MERSVFAYAVKRIKPLMILISVILLLRGHNEPGGGFIGGLIAASAYILSSLAFGVERVENDMRIKPVQLMALGLFLAVLSALPGILAGGGFMDGRWLEIALPTGKIKLGTPLLFDLGVYFAVIGFSLSVLFTLMEEWLWK